MEPDNSRGDRIVAGIARAGGGLLRIGGIALLVYVVSMSIFAIFKYSTTKSTLLSYGLSDATGTLIAWAVMFIAIGIPGLAIFRLFIFRGRPYDYAAAMILPLISWGMAQIPANFDAQTGEALKFCSNRPDNTLFCLDRPGIDPLTQKKLVPMNPSLAEIEFRKDRGLAPKRIAQPVAEIVFFDPLTAQPKVWVHKNDQGCFDMFNNPGVDPQSGEPLSPITKEAVRIIKQCGNTATRNQERVQATIPQEQTCPQSNTGHVRQCMVTESGVLIMTEESVNPGEFEFCYVRPEGTQIQSKWLGPSTLRVESKNGSFPLEYKWIRKSVLVDGKCPDRF